MQKKSESSKRTGDGSITLFLALTLALILSLLFSLLEASRVQGLAMLAQRRLQLNLESAFGRYHIPMWQDYHMLFLDGRDQEGQFDLSVLEGIMMKEDALRQQGASFYQMALKDIEIDGYSLAADEKGTPFRMQACKAAREQLTENIADSVKGQIEKGEELAGDREEMQEKWKQAQNASAQAEDMKTQEESPETGIEAAEESDVPLEEELPENPMDFVSMWKSSPVLALVVENSSEISGKAISLKDSLKNRKKEAGNLADSKGEKLEKLWLGQYLNYYFSCQGGVGQGGSGSHALDYELEYCIGGKETDKENLEQAVKELLLMREAGNFATIMQDSKKQELALEMAAAAVGFTGLAPLIQAVQIGILLAWSYMESILDVRCLLAGGKVPLVKEISDWKSDVFSGQKAIEAETENQKDGNGLTYREYLQILLLTVKEETLAYRAMDIIENNIRMIPGEEQFRMDYMIYGVETEALYSAGTLFLGFVTSVKVKDGTYHFDSKKRFFYSCGQ